MENIRIQDDLYTYVNQAKLEELVIPEDMPIAGGFATLNTDVEKLMIGEFNTMCAEGVYPCQGCKKKEKARHQACAKASVCFEKAGYHARL